jgi:mono/diheme cytochrome c family protein
VTIVVGGVIPSGGMRRTLLLSLVLAGCTGKYIRPTTPDRIAGTPERLARGNYLVNQVTACGVCHTPRLGGSWLGGERTDAFLAGGAVFDNPAGVRVVASNITQDRDTGIGAWSDDEILRALRDGIGHEGRLLMPPMPFTSWQVMSDEDARAIVAYLRTVPPVKNVVSREQNHFPFFMNAAAKLGAIHHPPARGVPQPARTDLRAWGAYLVKVGVCWECHSLGKTGPSDDQDRLMGGARMPRSDRDYGVVYAPNLTPDPDTGLGKYNAEQIKQALKTGKRLDGKMMAPPMSLLIPHLSTWNEEDLDALVAYLVSLKPINYKVPERALNVAAKRMVGE